MCCASKSTITNIYWTINAQITDVLTDGFTLKPDKSLIKAAKKGSASAQTKLGRFYEWHCVLKKEKKEETAIFWYLKAAEQGNPEAQVSIGYHYEFGVDIVQDEDKAIFWYTKAAEQGDKYAQYRLIWYDYDKTHTLSNLSDRRLRDIERRAYYDYGTSSWASTYRKNFGFAYFYGSQINGFLPEKNQEKAIFWCHISEDYLSLQLLRNLNFPHIKLYEPRGEINKSSKKDDSGEENQLNTTIQITKSEAMNLKDRVDSFETYNTSKSRDKSEVENTATKLDKTENKIDNLYKLKSKI